MRTKNRTLVQCETCGKSVERIPYFMKINKHHYCSQKCSHEGRKARTEKERWTALVCPVCRKVFRRRKCVINAAKKKSKSTVMYCSQCCSGKVPRYGRRGPTGKAHTEICMNCGESFRIAPSYVPNKKYGVLCGWDCRREYRKKRPLRIREWRIAKCDGCGKEFERNPKNDYEAKKRGFKKIYCSRECRFESNRARQCVDCGSRDLKGGKTKKNKPYIESRCKPCSLAHRRKLRPLLTCVLCGFRKPDTGNIRARDRPLWKCRECNRQLGGLGARRKPKIYAEKVCKECRETFVFVVKGGKKGEFCSRHCARTFLGKIRKVDRETEGCIECGDPLRNATHTSYNHPVCDVCMYLRRTRYKTRDDNNKYWALEFVTKTSKYLIRKGVVEWRVKKIVENKKKILKKTANLSARLRA